MQYRDLHIIVNPVSSGGYTGRNWDRVEKILRDRLHPFSVEFTTCPGDATRKAAAAKRAGISILAIAGGDGTLSEVVNGILSEPAGNLPKLALLNMGTGSDFARSLGVPSDIHLAVDSILNGRTIHVDAGRLECRGSRDESIVQYFVNVAGFGIDAEVTILLQNWQKRFGAFSYYLASLNRAFFYRNRPVRISLDGGPITVHNVVTVAICNGQFFGGGMAIAPGAEISDGFLDITVVDGWSLPEKILNSRRMYDGSITSAPGVIPFRAKEITAESLDERGETCIQSDGEPKGRLPLRAKILPGALPFLI